MRLGDLGEPAKKVGRRGVGVSIIILFSSADNVIKSSIKGDVDKTAAGPVSRISGGKYSTTTTAMSFGTLTPLYRVISSAAVLIAGIQRLVGRKTIRFQNEDSVAADSCKENDVFASGKTVSVVYARRIYYCI